MTRYFQKTPIVIFFIGLLIIVTSCSSSKKAYNPQKKISPSDLQSDFDIAWKTYQTNHPAYDWHTPADSINQRFQKVRNSLKDSLTEPEFRARLAYALSIIRCGHTSVRTSKAYAKYSKNIKEPVFPFAIKIWGKDSMVVIGNFPGDSSPLKRGTIITAINGVPAGTFISQMEEYCSTDGFSIGFKEIQISGQFGARFKWLYGLPKKYNIDYIDSAGNPSMADVYNFNPIKQDSLTKLNKDSLIVPPKTPIQKFPSYGYFKIDTATQTGILVLNTFSHKRIPKLIRSGFKSARFNSLKNLVIDLRSNGGGKISNSTFLTRYTIDHPFRVADSVTAKSFKLAYPKYTQTAWVYRYFPWLFSKKSADGKRHLRSLEKTEHNPKRKAHFDGEIYVLTSGASFSASTLFLSKVYGQKNVHVVGEETGGGARGNSAVMTPNVTLPHSGVRVRLPMFKLISNADLPDNGHGIIPDYKVVPDSWYIRKGVDKKMEKVYELIRQKKKEE